MSRLMWKTLLGLIYVLNEIIYGNCFRKKRIPDTLQLRSLERREAAEQEHYADFVANKDVYKNWPEVHVNPKYKCEKFLQLIFPEKNMHSATSKIRKVILNYKLIKDENNNIPTPKSVTALECKLISPVRSRKFIHFIRSPQSSECALFLNRIGKSSINFYIVEDICEYKDYIGFWKFVEELREDKLEHGDSKNKHIRQQILLLKEEMKVVHTEFEQKHYDYCSINEGMCKFWPEVEFYSESDCQRFFRRLLPENKDLSVVTSLQQIVKLHYLQIRDENNRIYDPVLVKAVACRLPQPVRNRKYLYFIRAPSYPICVYLILWKKNPHQYVYIAKEICDIPSCKHSLAAIFFEHEKCYSPTNV